MYYNTVARSRNVYIPPRLSSLGEQRLYGYVLSYAKVKRILIFE